ncbi:lanthionine synthetase [Nocardiopsis gilva YIM 90087]|uniref:Lanthionine synthetase n=1 Tax=Nocardiopsis gilva YIM 90087 TaxID=1235441 RepID=A0A223SCJ0_9ACTN|nr:lanthionine synthetase [Nocardiopsis gilva YIM 90087]
MLDRLVQRLSAPHPPNAPGEGQSLAQGAAGTALLHIERAHTRQGTWDQAHRWITAATTGQVSAADTTGLFLGAPAIAFMLHAAAAGTSRYADALSTVDHHVSALAHRRVHNAMSRIHSGALATFGEYDVFYGLTGIGAYLLHRDPSSSALQRVLDYLVALTRPVMANGQTRPGWWVAHDPHRRTSPHFPGGHGNLGVAHGITGPLLLLSQALRRGVTVDGHQEAITTISAHLDHWQQNTDPGPWWPEHLTAHDLATGTTHQPGPTRPSWCYGTPGIARAGQLAALAIGDTHRQRFFECALDRCLSDPVQVERLTDASLCHGWAGLYQTVWRMARDATFPTLADHLPRLAAQLLRHADPTNVTAPGLLEGQAGAALPLITSVEDREPVSGWDACLLID